MEWLFSHVLALADNVVAFILSIGSMALVGVAFMLTIFTMLISNIMIAVALALGPLILAFSVLGKFRDLTWRWISYLVSALMVKVIVFMLVDITSVELNSIVKIVADPALGATGNGNLKTIPYLLIMILTGGMVLTIMKAGSIASALFSGAVSAAEGGGATNFIQKITPSSIKGAGKGGGGK